MMQSSSSRKRSTVYISMKIFQPSLAQGQLVPEPGGTNRGVVRARNLSDAKVVAREPGCDNPTRIVNIS